VISVSTLAFALACIALFSAVGALLTCYQLTKGMDLQRSSNELRLRSHAASIDAAKKAVSARLAELDRRSPQKDAAEVAALREAVDSLKATQQRFAGKFYKQLQLDGGNADSPPMPGGALPLNGLDPELAAELALQSAPPVSPGRS
jgi:hypothetical protein